MIILVAFLVIFQFYYMILEVGGEDVSCIKQSRCGCTVTLYSSKMTISILFSVPFIIIP